MYDLEHANLPLYLASPSFICVASLDLQLLGSSPYPPPPRCDMCLYSTNPKKKWSEYVTTQYVQLSLEATVKKLMLKTMW